VPAGFSTAWTCPTSLFLRRWRAPPSTPFPYTTLFRSLVACHVDDKRLVFSGDLGRYDVPIMVDPDPVAEADVLLVESTYGNRVRSEEHTSELQSLTNVVCRLLLAHKIRKCNAASSPSC